MINYIAAENTNITYNTKNKKDKSVKNLKFSYNIS